MIAQEPLYTAKTVLELVASCSSRQCQKTVFLTFKPFDDFLPLMPLDTVSIVLAARLGDHT